MALIVARITGKRVGLRTATRMAKDARFSRPSSQPSALRRTGLRPPDDTDELRELKRIVGDEDKLSGRN